MMKLIFLLAGAIGWGISILGVILPWQMMVLVLQNLGAAAGPFPAAAGGFAFRFV